MATVSFDKSGKPTLGYIIFLHLSELKIRKKGFCPCLPLIKSKLLVTDTLISQTENQSDFTDLEALKREQIFRQRLRMSMLRTLRQRSSGVSQMKEVTVKSTMKREMKRSKEDDEEERSAKRQKLADCLEDKQIVPFDEKRGPRRALAF